MAHTWCNGLDGSWFNTYVPSGDDLSALDGLLTNCVNGDGGGTYTPSAELSIGGAGVNVLGPWTVGTGSLVESSTSLPFTLGDSDFFELGSSLTRTIDTQGNAGRPTSISASFETVIGWDILSSSGFALRTFRSTGSSLPVPLALCIPLRVHDGATFVQVELQWAVGQSHSSVPENLPKWRVVKINAATGQMTPLNSTFSGDYDSLGYLLMTTPSSGSSYYNSGALYSPVYACDADEIVDTSTYSYVVEIIDEWGPSDALVGNLYYSALAEFTVTDMAFQI
jgi:hypothetical protein